MIVQAYNPSTTNLEKSYLSKSYAAGVVSIVVRNSDRFAVNSRIMIGEMGNENTEIITVSGVNADKITLDVGATQFPHTASDPVYVLTYDQIKFYRSITTVDGSYSIATTVAMDVDNEQKKTLYNDPTGLSAYFYKVTYYHSIAAVESSFSDPIPGEGYGRKQVGTLVNEFLGEVGDLQQEYITVPQILGLLNECNEDIIGQSKRPYRFLKKTVLLDIAADEDTISLTDVIPDIIRFYRAKYTNSQTPVGSTTGNIPMVSIEEMEYYKYENTVLPNPYGVGIQAAALDDVDDTLSLVIYPTSTTAQTDAIKVYYWGDFDYITGLADTLQTPVKRIYKLFLLGRFYRMRAKKESSFLALSDRYMSDYNTEIVKMQRAQKVDIGTPASMKPDTRTTRGLRR